MFRFPFLTCLTPLEVIVNLSDAETPEVWNFKDPPSTPINPTDPSSSF